MTKLCIIYVRVHLTWRFNLESWIQIYRPKIVKLHSFRDVLTSGSTTNIIFINIGSQVFQSSGKRRMFVLLVMLWKRLLLLSNNECLSALHVIPSLLEKTKEETCIKTNILSRIKILSHELPTLNIYMLFVSHVTEEFFGNRIKTIK